MKRSARNILIVTVVVCLLTGIYWFYRERQSPETKIASVPKEAKELVASVNVVPVKRAVISTSVVAYGEVVPAPGAIQVVSVPYESQVLHVMVSNAQKISVNDALLEIGLSPNTKLRLEQARNEHEISQKSLKHVQELFDLKLATNNQLLKAEQAFKQAELRLESLKQQGISDQKEIRANVTGLVNKVYVQEGAIVPAGNPLLEIVAQNRLEVRLGVEPGDIGRLASGRSVSLSFVNEPAQKGVTGKIRKISHAVNPTTRLMDVFVSLPGSAGFLLGEYVTGRIEAASSYGIVVPRSAVLPEEGNYVLYTVRNGRAVKHLVQVGLESSNEVQVSGGDLNPDDLVVVLGNYELEDGMAVKATRTR